MPSLKNAFYLSFLFIVISPAVFPSFHLLFFAPYLVLCFYKLTRYQSLLRAFFAGVIVDCFSSSPFFGAVAINYCIVSFLLHGQRRNFFEDKFFTLPVMSALYSFLSKIVWVVVLFFFKQKSSFTGKWYVFDIFGLSLLDGLYALLFFYLPFQLTQKISKMGLFKFSKKSALDE